MDILALFFPKEKKFYQMVEKQVALVNSAVSDFSKLVKNYNKLSSASKKRIILSICAKEEKNDQLYTEMVRALKSTFITPMDREDLYKLVMTFKMIMDSLEMMSHKTETFQINIMNKYLVEQTEVIHLSFEQIEKLIFSIRNESQVEKACSQVRMLEQKGDKVYIQALGKLFSGATSPLDIIKLKDIYSTMEKIVDKIHEASLIIENIAVKYS